MEAPGVPARPVGVAILTMLGVATLCVAFVQDGAPGGAGTWARAGVVGVDSGQLLLIDPCYMADEWVPIGKGTDWQVEYWGRDEEVVRDEFGASPITCADKEGATALRARITRHCAARDLMVVTSLRSGCSYDLCCDITTSRPGFGPLKYRAGHPGLGVVTATGFGDGTFPVYARTDDQGRVVEIRVLFNEDGKEAKRFEDILRRQRKKQSGR